MAISRSSLRAFFQTTLHTTFLAIFFFTSSCLVSTPLHAMGFESDNYEKPVYTKRAHGIVQLAQKGAAHYSLEIPEEIALNIAGCLDRMVNISHKNREVEYLLKQGRLEEAIARDSQNLRLKRIATKRKRQEEAVLNRNRRARRNERAKVSLFPENSDDEDQEELLQPHQLFQRLIDPALQMNDQESD